MRYITIDPGLTGTGYAIWETDWALVENGVYTPKVAKPLPQKRIDICESLIYTCSKHNVKHAYIEYPQMFGGNKGSMVAAKGDLVKLAALVGYISGCLAINNIKVWDVTVIEWKGQMTKEAVINRIKRLIPYVKAKSHDYDAIGIGLYIKGVF